MTKIAWAICVKIPVELYLVKSLFQFVFGIETWKVYIFFTSFPQYTRSHYTDSLLNHVGFNW